MTSTARPRLGWHRLPVAALLAAGALTTSVVVAQTDETDTPDTDASTWVEHEAGIPVTDPLTREKCGTCHTADDKGNLSRISWIRSTPEGWAQTIKRMVKLNGLDITPQEARAVTTYLSTYHGLAPEEAKPVMYLAEKRILQSEAIVPNDTLRETCASCHAFAQPMSSRRSHREWALLQNMHRALYSTADFIYDTPVGSGYDEDGGSAPEDGKPPVKQATAALEWLSKNAPLHTPEWAAWRPRIKTPQLAGKWLVSADLPGRGRFVGEMTVAPKAPGSNEFVTSTVLRSLEDGSVHTRKGSALIYTGFSWRGTSDGAAKTTAPDDLDSKLRETMWFAPDQALAMGRWYWGEYHEFGFDVTLRREAGAPAVAAVSSDALKIGSKGTQVHIYGANLPTSLTPTDVDFGSGVTVSKVVSATPNEAVVTLDVAANAVPGLRDLSVGGAVLAKALPVYASVDYVKVTPETALAHLGGIKFAKGYEQFAAYAYSNGPDGKRGTDDDFAIRPIDVTWSLAEFTTTTYDNDVKFVGTIDPAKGLFTPNVEGPDPARRFGRNNYGEVWVVATAKDLKGADGKPLIGRSYLVTTVPTYKRWDQPEVSE
ncbi:quinohemoprotein amine dehydrogenase subunit alpha [Novosphingobium sp. 1949]|uniref:Quinohemoprotein amine dehydrogenase subunit alpha n=1 Tax=Novosphingobium organovorum TaxID=2930092 RepID=A0ABT0BFH5_9SPHN|nr:quinohemoprotein amine dehydrogenase subunit alpha [Novosphingobium organovorum]MCJ2183797.1 quinohemoprotein amine dehydrogenase subunit alpha [Novosphingobium organovorum]